MESSVSGPSWTFLWFLTLVMTGVVWCGVVWCGGEKSVVMQEGSECWSDNV